MHNTNTILDNVDLNQIESMNYVQFMAFMNETNRPPGGKGAVRKVAQQVFLNSDNTVLDVGCNTGFISFELARLTKCSVIGVDISTEMIKVANEHRSEDGENRDRVSFCTGDVHHLEYPDKTFDLVISGGSTAFMSKPDEAVKEYKRLVKPWGFIAELAFFYHEAPPRNLISRLCNALDIDINLWGLNWWRELFTSIGLEEYYCEHSPMNIINTEVIEEYAAEMIRPMDYSNKIKEAVNDRLIRLMKLFNENHNYLSKAILIYRSRPIKEQITLFGY